MFSHQNGLATSHVAKRAGRRATTRAMAHTIDISHIGCRLGDCARISLPGRPLRLQRGRQKASFRVIWSKHLAANENQAGIEALNYEGNTWGVDLPLSRYIPCLLYTSAFTSKVSSVAGNSKSGVNMLLIA